MKKMSLLMACVVIFGCAGADLSAGKQSSATGSLFMKASVVRVDGDTAVLQTDALPENMSKDSPIASLTSKILNLTYLTEGSKTTINGKNATVTEKRGDSLMIMPSAGLKAGDTAELFIPKKTLIISDLKVTDNSKNMIGKLAFGEFAEKLTNSGRFTVLERKELAAILQEHALELKGMTDPEQASLLVKSSRQT